MALRLSRYTSPIPFCCCQLGDPPIPSTRLSLGAFLARFSAYATFQEFRPSWAFFDTSIRTKHACFPFLHLFRQGLPQTEPISLHVLPRRHVLVIFDQVLLGVGYRHGGRDQLGFGCWPFGGLLGAHRTLLHDQDRHQGRESHAGGSTTSRSKHACGIHLGRIVKIESLDGGRV